MKSFKLFSALTFVSLLSVNCSPDIGTGAAADDDERAPISDPPNPTEARVQLEATPREIQVGALALGETSETYTITIQSMDKLSDEIALVTDEQVNIVSTDCEGTRLDKGESCTAELVVEATEQAFEATEISITDGNGSAHVALLEEAPQTDDTQSQTGTTPTIAPSSYNFRQVYKHMTRVKSFTLQNTTSSPLGPLRTTLVTNSPFRFGDDSCKGRVLAPGATCSVQVMFQPFGDSRDSATLVISAELFSARAQILGSGEEDG